MRAANLGLKFVLELCAVAGLAYFGASVASGVGAVILSIACPVAAIVVWGRWCAPRAPRRLPTQTRIPVELGVFGVAAVAIAVAGEGALAAVFAVAVVVNAALLTRLHQWEG